MTVEVHASQSPHRVREPDFAGLALPPIDALPNDVEQDVLTNFVWTRTRPWGGVAAPLSGAVIGALWTILVLNLAFGGWLLAVRAGVTPCSGIFCTAVTLGGHPVLTLVLTEVSAGALALSVPMTRGLSQAGGPQLAVIVIGALAGIVALSGAVLVLLVALFAVVLILGVLANVVERM